MTRFAMPTMVLSLLLTIFLVNNVAGQTPTIAPTTAAPVSPAPVTPAPVTSAPVSPAPVTSAPVTPAPVTPAPVTPAPVTSPPVTAAPVTAAPVTAAPVTAAPVTLAPVTAAPVTGVPVTLAPITGAPASTAPVTMAPASSAPVTLAPTTAAPVTLAPATVSPITSAPVTDMPSASPSMKPSDSPTNFPSESPSLLPSTSPSSSPSTSPSVVPSSSPTDIPSSSPSASPSGVGSDVPSRPPSGAPSSSPSTPIPSSTPSTPFPSDTPSMMPTMSPSGSLITPSPYSGLTIRLDGVGPLSPSSVSTFQSVTKAYIENFFIANPLLGAVDVVVSLSVTGQNPPFTGRRRLLSGPGSSHRALQSEVSTTITFTQTMMYRATRPTTDDETIINAPFLLRSRRDDYTTQLKGSGDPAFDTLTAVTQVSQPKPPDEEEDDGPSNTLFIIIGVCGGIAVLLIGALLCVFVCRRKSPKKGYTGNVGDSAPASSIAKDGGEDVSTLQDPSRVGNAAAHEGLAGYGDQSVATVDYDYSKAYGGGADNSVSSAGGTFGSNAHTLGAGQTLPDMAADRDGMAATFSDDVSFGANYQESNVREELIDIFAPPGKLGVVIDTPDDGAPVVHAIKDSSVIADKLQVGDKLVAVDDEDVRTMTAIKVSKLISRKSANATRKLSIVRTVAVE